MGYRGLFRGSNRGASNFSTSTNDVVSPAKKKSVRKRKLEASKPKHIATSEEGEGDEFSLPGSVNLAFKYPPLQPQHKLKESLNTTNSDEMSTMSQDGLLQDTSSSFVVFDFEPEVSLDLGICFDPYKYSANIDQPSRFQQRGLKNYNYYNMQRDQSSKKINTISTDEEILNERKHGNNLQRNMSYHNSRWKEVEEDHNQYLERRFNRHRIERYLDILCPPDCDDSTNGHGAKKNKHNIPVPPQEKIKMFNQENESDLINKRLSLDINSSSAVMIKDDINLPTDNHIDANESISNEKVGKSNDGFSLKEDINDSIKYSSESYKPPQLYGIFGKMPSLIDISTPNDDEDYSTIADSVLEMDDLLTPPEQEKETTTPTHLSTPNHNINIKQINSYYTNQSPNGVENFDQKKFKFETTDIQSSHHDRSKAFSRSPTTGLVSISSPTTTTTTYTSTNILKIKSRLREIETEYQHIKACLVAT